MANKYLLCADEASAIAKSASAYAYQNPNLAVIQAELAASNTHPNLHYPPAEECTSKYLNHWHVDADSGAAELVIPDEHKMFYPYDINSLRNWQAVAVAQGPQEGN